MRERLPYLVSFMLWLSMVTTATSQGIQTSLNESFALIKNITNLYLIPNETVYIDLDEYFRGNFLTYSFILQNKTEEGELVPYFGWNENLIKLTPQYKEIDKVDIKQTDQQHSLPQTTLLFTDPTTFEKYLIFIDYEMKLHIYELSSYLKYEDTAGSGCSKVSETALFSAAHIDPDDRLCNNLIVIDAYTLIMNCKGKNGYAVQLYISIQDMQAVQTRYSQTHILFEVYKVGKFVYLKKPTNENYLILGKEDRTACFFDVQLIEERADPQVIRRVSFFHQPPLTEEEEQRYHNEIIPKVPIDCQQSEPMKSKSARTIVDFMQIQDIEVVPFYENVVVATDYNAGLLFMEMNCTNSTHCDYRPITGIYDFTGLSEIAIMRDEGLIKEQILFVLKVNPPMILECKYLTRQKPSIRRVYTVQSDDRNYISLSLVDANQDYVLTHMFSTALMKPVFRIYKRGSFFLSIGHADITYTDFYDEGTFFQFISVSSNYFLLKTSDYFSIYKIQRQQLVINATSNNLGKKLLDSTIQALITVRDLQGATLQGRLEFKILSSDKTTKTYRKYQSDQIGKEIQYYYNCGEKSLRIDIDQLFEGFKDNPLILTDLNPAPLQGLFEPSKYTFEYLEKKIFNIKGCELKSILLKSKELLLQCMNINTDTIFFVRLEDADKVPLVQKQEFAIKSARILEFSVEQDQDEMFILSNGTSRIRSKAGAVVHYMKYYNILTWEGRVELNEEYEEIENFKFRQFNAISFQKNIKMGILISDPEVIKHDLSRVQLLLYDLNKESNYADLRIIGVFHIKITDPQIQLMHTQMDRHANIWVVLSNSTLNLYHFDKKASVEFSSDKRKKMNAVIFLKKQYYFGGHPKLANQSFHSIRTFPESNSSDIILLFFGQNTTQVKRFYRGDGTFYQLMELPFTHGVADVDIEAGTEYQFVINDFKRDVTLEIVDDRIVFLLMRRLVKGSFFGYTIFVFDVLQQSHGALLIKKNLPPDTDVKNFNVRIEAFKIQENFVEVYIFTDETTMLHYRVKFVNEIEITQDERIRLMKSCAREDVELRYKIKPKDSDNLEEEAQIVIKTQNTGLVIVQTHENDNLTLINDGLDKYSLSDRLSDQRDRIKRKGIDFKLNKDKRQKNKTSGSYSLLRVFQGQNMSYQVRCQDPAAVNQDDEYFTKEDCQNLVRWNPQSRIFSREIEVLGSNVKLIGFFNLDPALLFFDTNYLHVYFPEDLTYEPQKSSTFLNERPVRFFRNTLTDSFGNQSHFLLFQTENYRFGVTMMFSSLSQSICEQSFFQNPKLFLNIKNTIFIKKSKTLMQVPWDIFQTELYRLDTPMASPNNGGRGGGEIKVRVILAIYDEKVLYNSMIRFFDISFKSLEEDPVYDFQKETVLSTNRLFLDQFIVNSITMMGNTSILALGIQDFGIILYNVVEYKIYKFVKMAESVHQKKFFFNALISPASLNEIFAILNNNAVFSITVYSNYTRISSVYYDNSVGANIKRECARGQQGYAFIQGTAQDQSAQVSSYPIMKFFTFYANNNSQGIGEINLEFNEDCKYLLPLSLEMTKNNFISDLTEESMIVGMICGGSLLKIMAFDYRPDLVFDKDAIKDRIELNQDIYIKPMNDYINGSLSSDKEFTEFKLSLQIKNLEQTSNMYILLLYVTLIAIASMILVICVMKQTTEEHFQQKKKERNQLSSRILLEMNEEEKEGGNEGRKKELTKEVSFDFESKRKMSQSIILTTENESSRYLSTEFHVTDSFFEKRPDLLPTSSSIQNVTD